MANTRKSSKRSLQADKRNERNQIVRGQTRSALRNAIESLKAKDAAAAKAAYVSAVKAVSKAAAKGSIPKGRAARKISRLTRLVKKTNPTALNFK